MPYVPVLFAGNTSADPRLVLPGTAADYLSTPNSAALHLVNGEWIAAIAFSAMLNETIVGKWLTGTDQEYLFRFSSGGNMNLVYSTTGANAPTATTGADPPAFTGSVIWLRARHTDSTGDTDFTWAPYNGPTEPTTWYSSTASLNRTALAGALFAGADFLRIGVGSSVTPNPANGYVYRVILKSAGVVVADMDPADWTGGTSWTSSRTGEVWTLNGAASIAGVTPAVQRPYWGTLASR